MKDENLKLLYDMIHMMFNCSLFYYIFYIQFEHRRRVSQINMRKPDVTKKCIYF